MSDLIRVSSLEPGVRVIRLALPETMDSGEFDRLNESMLTAVADTASGGWVIDLSNLAYAGSSVLGLLVNIRQRIKLAGGRLVLCGLSDHLMQTFRTCSLERLFVIRRTTQDAAARAR